MLGASGVIGLPFASSANAAFAQQLTPQISAAIQNHVTSANRPSTALVPLATTSSSVNSINAAGNVAMNASNATGNELFWAGAGDDTIWTGLGNDSVVFTQRITGLSGGAGQDTVIGWNSKDTLITFGYGLNPGNMTNTASGGRIVLSFSDGTRLTFAGVIDPTAIKLLSD